MDNSFVYTKSLEQIYQESDIISIHMPATDDNYHQFNHEVFEQMKDTAILINTARGSIVDTDDLTFALQSGEIAGAGIDTIENESADLQDSRSTKKVSDPDVLKMSMMPNVLITPHSAFHTSEAVKNMIDISLGNLETMVTGETPKDLVD